MNPIFQYLRRPQGRNVDSEETSLKFIEPLRNQFIVFSMFLLYQQLCKKKSSVEASDIIVCCNKLYGNILSCVKKQCISGSNLTGDRW